MDFDLFGNNNNEKTTREVKWDMELINNFFETQMTGLFKTLSQNGSIKNIKLIDAIPEKLLRRYIEKEEYIQRLLQYKYVGWYLRFNPNGEFRDFKEKFKKDLIKKKAPKDYISNQLKQMREKWNATKGLRYLTKIDKHWNREQIFRSYKKPLYIGTTLKLFQDAGQWAFYKQDWFAWEWKTPYLAVDTNKINFVKKITRLGFKEILVELKEIKNLESSAWVDENWNKIEPIGIEDHIKKIIEILENPLKQVEREEEMADNIPKEDLEVLDLDL